MAFLKFPYSFYNLQNKKHGIFLFKTYSQNADCIAHSTHTRTLFSYILISNNLMQVCSHLKTHLNIYKSHAFAGSLFFKFFSFETYITCLQNFLSSRKFTSKNEITTWKLLPYSRAILGYLVEKYAKEDSLYPKDPKKRAVVNQMLYFDATTMYQRILNYYVSNVQKLFKIND
jgi:hypothetical protein